MFAEAYKYLFPDNKIFIFSRVKQDPVYENLNPIRIFLDEELLESPIDIEYLSNSLVIYDDIDVRSKDALSKEIIRLRDEIFENGRHYSITVLACAHTLLNYRETKTLLNESTAVILFPKGGYMAQIKRFLKEYVGIEDKKNITKLLNLPSRWVMIQKTYPMYIMYDSGVYIL